MALSSVRPIFGIHQVSPYNRTTGEFYGTIKVLKGSSLSLAGEQVKLNGGSSKYPYASETANITAELSLKFSEYPAFLFQLFLGKTPTEVTTPNTTGEISSPVNVVGASVIDATNGLNTVTVTPTVGAGNLKFGQYVLKATGADDLDIYVSTDITFDRGTSLDYANDLLKVGSVSLTGTTVVAADLGLTFTKAGTPAFTTGDTATFYVYPPYSRKVEVTIGSPSDVTPEFGAIVVAQKRADLELTALDIFRCKASGMPLGFEEKAFSESEVKVDCLFDPAKNGVFKFMSLKPSS